MTHVVDEWQPKDLYTMEKIREFKSRKWATTNSTYEIKIQPFPEDGWQEKLLQILHDILRKVKAKAKPRSVGRVVVFIDGIKYPINDRVDKIDQLNVQQLVEKVAAVLNSNDEADLSKDFTLNIIFTEMKNDAGSSTQS